MNSHSAKPAVLFVGFLCVLVLASSGLWSPASARELASEAIAAAVENGTLDELSQALLIDLYQKERFDFDEEGIEAVGRSLLDSNRHDAAIEVLLLNLMINQKSAPAANALADAYLESGNSPAAGMMYRQALDIDPGNAHAGEALKMLGGEGGAVEQPRYSSSSSAETSRKAAPAGASSAISNPPASGVTYESEYCVVLHRFNSDKKISDANVRARVEGEYCQAGDANRVRTWNVETTCGEFLVAVPLWADVSPPLLSLVSATVFTDSMGATWEFQVGGDGAVTGVTMSDAQGAVTEMKRLGDPRSHAIQ